MMKKKIITPELKKASKVCDVEALKESLGIMIHNKLCDLAYGKEADYRKNQGNLSSLEEILSLISKP